MGFHWPDNFSTVPLLERIAGRTCHFKDGSKKEIDAIILCTGYKHHFPFLEPSLRLQTANVLWIDSLHEGVVWPDNPKLMSVGPRLVPSPLSAALRARRHTPSNRVATVPLAVRYIGMQDQWFTFNMFDAQAWCASSPADRPRPPN